MNGESHVKIDRGQWRYRFALDSDNLAIYRSPRSGQALVPVEAWRDLATLGISDAFVVQVPGGWQPFVELADGQQRWALQKRPTRAEAEKTAAHFLLSLAHAVATAAWPPPGAGDKEAEARAQVPEPPEPPSEELATEEALAEALSVRDSGGWELVYTRERTNR